VRPLPEPIAGRITIVGPCASGKSELVSRLVALGYDARHTAQEHSYVPSMWCHISRPQVLVYLDASLETIAVRRPSVADASYIQSQRQRLAHAREHCDLYLCTDHLTPSQVLKAVVGLLDRLGIVPAPGGASPQGR
jgi:ribosome-interacting GTPase 1